MLHNGSRISQLIPKTVVVENEEVSIRGPAGDLNDISERRRKRVAGLRMAKENGGRPGFVAGGRTVPNWIRDPVHLNHKQNSNCNHETSMWNGAKKSAVARYYSLEQETIFEPLISRTCSGRLYKLKTDKSGPPFMLGLAWLVPHWLAM